MTNSAMSPSVLSNRPIISNYLSAASAKGSLHRKIYKVNVA